jgi:hypothetical protein
MVYSLYPDFTPGQRCVVIPEADIGVTVHSRQARERREGNTTLRQEIRRLLASWPGTDARARKLLSEAEEMLTAALGETELAERPPKPSARVLARTRYGLDGGRPAPRTKPGSLFGLDGKRLCSTCGKPRLPEDFGVYWMNRERHWMLYSACFVCERARMRNRKGGGNGS